MDLMFEFLQGDVAILLAVTAVSIMVAVAALWVLTANLRKK